MLVCSAHTSMPVLRLHVQKKIVRVLLLTSREPSTLLHLPVVKQDVNHVIMLGYCAIVSLCIGLLVVLVYYIL
jgi:hypothetical protein